MQHKNKDIQCIHLPREQASYKHLIGEEAPISQENIGDLILNAFKSRPNFVGQVNVQTEEELTFQQMRENSVKCALWLKKVGVKKGDVITICTRNPSVVYAPFLASIYIGAVVNPWEETYFKDIIRVMYFLVKNQPDVIFVDHDHFIKLLVALVILKSIKKIIKIVTIGELKFSIKFNSLKSILNENVDKTEIDEFSCERINMRDTAIRTFSCIATKYPGQVDVPYIAFVSPSNKQTPVMHAGDIGLWYESLCWTHGPLLTVNAILSHVTAIKSAVLSERNLFKTIQKYEVTWVFLKSEACNQLFKTDVFFSCDISSLKTFLFDNWEINRRVHESLFVFLSDVSVIRVYSKPEFGVIAYQRNINITKSSAGRVAKNNQLAFVDPYNMKRIGPGKFGMICCKTPYTKKCDILKANEKSWCSTGDMGYYNKDGQLFVIPGQFGRYIKDKNKIIFPYDLEVLFREHPAVSEAIVTSVQHSSDVQYPVVYVKLKPGEQVTKAELKEFIENATNYEFRGGVHFIRNKIQRLPNGKIYRDATLMQN